MSAAGKNFEAIAKAKAQHAERCPSPPHTIVMCSYDIERMGWAEGDDIAGLRLVADDTVQSDRFRLLCDATAPRTPYETTAAVAEDRELQPA